MPQLHDPLNQELARAAVRRRDDLQSQLWVFSVYFSKLFWHKGSCQLKQNERVEEGEVLGAGGTASLVALLECVGRRHQVKSWPEEGLLTSVPILYKHSAVQTWLYTFQDLILASSCRCTLNLSQRKIYGPGHLKSCYHLKIINFLCLVSGRAELWAHTHGSLYMFT